jgi:hypothetical protein
MPSIINENARNALFHCLERRNALAYYSGPSSITTENVLSLRRQTVTYHVDDAYSGFVAEVTYSGTPHYGNPAPHHAPEPTYHAPQPVYHAPEPAYPAPEPAYHAPKSAYHAPAYRHG